MAHDPPPVRVLHLVGSPTSQEFDRLSRLYATGALTALADVRVMGRRTEHLVAHVASDGRWRFLAGPTDDDLAAAPALPPAAGLARLAELEVDLMVPHLFCPAGMTTYRGLFDVLRVPYLGNRPSVMALGADKVQAKAVVAAAGVDTPPWQVAVTAQEPIGIEPPAVVKPVDSDNSWGLTLVRERGQYPEAVTAARRHGSAALVERFVPPGREVRCGVWEREGRPMCLPLEEYAVDPTTKPVRGADDKLADTADGRLRLVAKDAAHAWIVADDDPVVPAVHDAALVCHRALGARHYSLFDFRIDAEGRPWFLEAGLYCSFSPQSVLAVMAQAAGIGVADLFSGLAQDLLTEREGDRA